jgi:hypothetical protein
MGTRKVINRAVEPLVREAFNAVIVEDGKRFEEALGAIPDDQAKEALDLALAIDRTVMEDLHDGAPSEERLKYLVDGFHKMEDWYKTDWLPVEGFLRMLAGMPAEPISPDTIGLLAFLVGGWLLAGFLNPGVHWYEYLDDILDRLDVAP